MPRIPYVYPEVGQSEIADAIRQRRANGKLIGLDGVLLNAPAIAAGYSQLLGAVRMKSSLQPALRELLVIIDILVSLKNVILKCVRSCELLH